MERYKQLFYDPGDSLASMAEAEHNGAWIEGINGRYIYEEVLENIIELENLELLLYKNSNYIIKNNHDFNDFTYKINNVLENHKIQFIYSSNAPIEKFIIQGTYSRKEDMILLYYSSKIEKLDESNYKEFVNNFKNQIGHELVHREQSIRVKQDEYWKRSQNKDDSQYLSDKREVMAYAWEFINTFRMSGISDKNIKRILQTDSNIKLSIGGIIFQKYHKIFPKNGTILKLLYKYMYLYLED